MYFIVWFTFLQRLRDEMKRRDPRVQELLDTTKRPVPAILAGDEIAEQIRPNLLQSWANLQTATDSRSKQLNSVSVGMNLISEIVDLTEAINNKAADVDRLVNIRSNENLDSAKKRLLVRSCHTFFSFQISRAL